MKIASIHSRSRIGDLEFNLSETVSLVKELNEQKVEFALFPELNLSGYSHNPEIIKDVSNKKEQLFARLFQHTKELNIAFCVGFPELKNENYYISQVLIHKGKIKGIHRKTHLSPSEKTTFKEGYEIETFQTGELKLGMQLCFETHFPEISAVQANKKANLLCCSFASPNELAQEKLDRLKSFLCARAYDNSCYLMACNQSGETESGKEIPGLSLIINPKGKVIAKSLNPSNRYCIAELETAQINNIRNSKMAWFNSHKRIELFKKLYI